MPQPRRDADRNAPGAIGGRPRAQADRRALRDRQEALLDEAVEETFPASDPIAPARLL